jgi:hypothetical protein
MDMAMKVDELNMEPRELTLNELEEISAGFGWILLGALSVVAGYAFGAWLHTKLK